MLPTYPAILRVGRLEWGSEGAQSVSTNQSSNPSIGVHFLGSPVCQCWDNAPMESFLVHHEYYDTREHANTSLFEYVEVLYNSKRIHSSLGYFTLSDYKQAV